MTALHLKPNIYICVCVCVCVSKSAVLGILFLVEFGLLVADFGLVAIQATHTAHFNRGQQIVLQLWYSFLCIPFFTIYPWYSGAGGGGGEGAPLNSQKVLK